MKMKHCDTEIEIKECFELMKVLRPKLSSPQEFAEQILRQKLDGYRILAIEDKGRVIALAGYRQMENLVHGKFIYVDDLVTDPEGRGKNHGQSLLKEISLIAKELGKEKVVLDTGISNSLAQKFYFREGFLALGLHFIKVL